MAATPIQAEDQPADPPLDGMWGGWVEFLGGEHWFQLRIDGDSVGLYDYNVRAAAIPVRGVRLDGPRVEFVYDAGIGALRFVGERRDAALVGRIESAGREPGAFRFARYFDGSREQLERCIGRYEVDGKATWVVPRTGGGLRTMRHENEGATFADYSYDAWLPRGEASFVASTAIDSTDPSKGILAFDDEGLRVSGDGGFEGVRSEGGVRSMTFRSRGHELHGWLLTPPGEGPHPAIALAHGSGYVSADSPFDLYLAVRLARHLNVAVLRWDKPGVGESGGDQRLDTYHELAADIDAAVAALRELPDIDREKVGVGGLSQAPSWPIPIAVADSPNVAFVVAISGSTTTAAETNLFNWLQRMRKEGFEEESLASIEAFYRGLFPLTLDPSDEGQAAFDAYLREHDDEPWFASVCDLSGLDTPLRSPEGDRWRRIWNVDPIEHWARVACPVHQAWGAMDPLVDAKRSLARMEDLIARTGRTNFTSVVYPAPAAHAVGSGSTPTYFADLEAWFEREVLGR